MYSIGKVSKQTNVTVRTLQYYDKIGLLKPTKKTERGNRLYSKNDILKLQQILALKHMQYPLEEIKQMLGTMGSTWEESLQNQLEIIEQEERHLAQIKKAIRATLQSLALENELDWEIVSSLTQLYQQDDTSIKNHLDNFFTKEEQEELEKFPTLGENSQHVDEWLEIIKEVRENLHVDPSSRIAQNLANRWMIKVNEMFGQNDALRDKSWEFMKSDTYPAEAYPLDKEVIEFIEKAVNVLYK